MILTQLLASFKSQLVSPTNANEGAWLTQSVEHETLNILCLILSYIEYIESFSAKITLYEHFPFHSKAYLNSYFSS